MRLFRSLVDFLKRHYHRRKLNFKNPMLLQFSFQPFFFDKSQTRLFKIKELLFQIEKQIFQFKELLLQFEERFSQIKERLFEYLDFLLNSCSSISNVRRPRAFFARNFVQEKWQNREFQKYGVLQLLFGIKGGVRRKKGH